MVNRIISLIGERLCQKVKELTDQQLAGLRRKSRRREASRMEIVERRGRWVLTDSNGMVSKFSTEEEAKLAAGWVPPVEEILEDSEEEEEDCEEEA
jgi:hypothetical protein